MRLPVTVAGSGWDEQDRDSEAPGQREVTAESYRELSTDHTVVTVTVSLRARKNSHGVQHSGFPPASQVGNHDPGGKRPKLL